MGDDWGGRIKERMVGECVIVEGVRKMDGVVVGEVGMVVRVVEMDGIMECVRFVIWVVDRCGGRGIVMGDGERNVGGMMKGEGRVEEWVGEGCGRKE